MRNLKDKIKMPAKKAEEKMMDEELDMDLESLDYSGPESEPLSEEDMELEDLAPEAAEATSMLEDISDDDLLAEIKARGLSMADAETEEDLGEQEADAEEEELA